MEKVVADNLQGDFDVMEGFRPKLALKPLADALAFDSPGYGKKKGSASHVNIKLAI